MNVERNFDCGTCNVTAKFQQFQTMRYVEHKGLRGGYCVNLMRCLGCFSVVESLDQKAHNDENKMIAEQGLIIDYEVANGGDPDV